MSGFKADLYRVLKYAALIAWAIFVVAPFLWALSTSFKSDPGVVGGATYIPFLEIRADGGRAGPRSSAIPAPAASACRGPTSRAWW